MRSYRRELSSGRAGLVVGRRRLSSLLGSVRGVRSIGEPFGGCGVRFGTPRVARGPPVFKASG